MHQFFKSSSESDKKINQRKIFWMLLLLIPVFLSTVWVLEVIRQRNRENIRSVLQAILSTTQSALRSWADQQHKEVKFWANNLDVKTKVKDLILNPSPSVYSKLDQNLSSIVKRNEFVNYFILNEQGIVVADGLKRFIGLQGYSLLGSDKNEFDLGKYLKSRLSLPFHHESYHSSLATLALTTPIFVNGKFIALLGFHLDAKKDFKSATEISQVRKSVEIYAFNKNGQLFTGIGFYKELIRMRLLEPDDVGILKIQIRDPGGSLIGGHKISVPYNKLPLSKMAKQAIAGRAGTDLDGYRDYRGETVVGAWLWDKQLDMGLATEIDLDEAKNVYYLARALIIALMMLTVLEALIVSFVLWQKNKRLQEAVQARDDFLSLASHELNTPLTSLMLQVSLINKYIADGKRNEVSSENLEKLIQASNQQLRRFAYLINDLLYISRLRTGSLVLKPEQVKLNEIIHNVLDSMKYEIKTSKCSIVLTLDEEIQAYWDPNRIQQVIINLISNSMKYGPDKPIEIITQRIDCKAEIKIKDHSSGIAKIDHTRIFEQFVKASSIKHYGGLGLGLYISKQIIEAHRGSIRVESVPGNGSTFIVELPLS
jgi:signal transduction histidine kinase